MRRIRYQVAVSARERMAWQLIGKQIGCLANIAVFEKYRGGQQGWNKEKKAYMAKEKWSKKRKQIYWWVSKKDRDSGRKAQRSQIKYGKKRRNDIKIRGFAPGYKIYVENKEQVCYILKTFT